MHSSSVCYCTWLFIHAQEINGHRCSKLQRLVRCIPWWFWSLCHPPPDGAVQFTSSFLLPPSLAFRAWDLRCSVLRCAVQRTIVSHACLHRSILGSRCRFRGSKLAGTIRFRWIGWVPFQKGFVASYSQLKWNRVDRSLAADEFRKHRRDRDVFVTRCERPGAHSGCFDSGKAYRRRIRRRRGREKVGGRRCIRSRAVQVDRWSVTEGQDEETKRRKATTPWRTKWTFITRNSMT